MRFFTTVLTLATFYGAWVLVTENRDTLSPSESIGLAILSAALAGVLFLVVRPRARKNDAQAERTVKKKRPQTAELLGCSFIAAAMAFALFGLLTPFLTAVSSGQRFFPYTGFGDFSEWVTRFIAGISFMVGTVTLAMPLTFGPFLFAADLLRQRQKKRK